MTKQASSSASGPAFVSRTAALGRTRRLLGNPALKQLDAAHVAVFGLGGVGGMAAEALARAGVGHLSVIDADVFSDSNLNRQILSTVSAVGKLKTEVFCARAAEIMPGIRVDAYPLFYDADTADQIDFSAFDYIVDAIDSLASKLLIAQNAARAGVPMIACMGTGNKLDPMAFRVADLAKTAVCPLAKAVRVSLRKCGIHHMKVVYSEEIPVSPAQITANEEAYLQEMAQTLRAACPDRAEPIIRTLYHASMPASGRFVPASVSFVPPAAGLLLASEAVADLTARHTPVIPH